MASEKLIYQESFKIRASEVNIHQKATLPAICELLQEVAGNHARQLKFDITDLQQDKLTWVLHRLRVEVDQFPDWRDTITIQTWPSGGDGLRAHRDFLILDSENNIIGKSLSYWLILDIESRRPKRIPKTILESVPDNSEHVLPVDEGYFKNVEHPQDTQLFSVRKSDLDLNQHVNNVRYIEWGLACLPEEKVRSVLDIKFTGEAGLGDTVVAISTDNNQGDSYFEIRNQENQQTLALAQAK